MASQKLLAASCLLCLLVLYLFRDSKRPAQDLPLSENPGSPRSPGAITGSFEDRAQIPFQWRQLEAGGYRAYISRLRQIGCPDRTVHDIVAGDVERLYASRRFQLHLGGSGSGPWSLAEETRLIAHLCGEEVGAALSTEATVSEANGAATSEEPVFTYPLAFAVSETELLDEGQLEALEELRQQFMLEVGGANQNPDDPAYGDRWLKAQPEIDALVPGLLGRQAFLRLQLGSSASSP